MNIERLKYLLEIPLDEIQNKKDLKAELIEYYKFIFNTSGCSTCKDKFPLYHKKLIEKGIEKFNVLTSGNFKLRNDVGLVEMEFGSGQFLSQANATDELCIAFLRINPNRISLFERYPENWKILIENNIVENEND